MDVVEVLSKGSDRTAYVKVANYVGDCPKKFQLLMELFWQDSLAITQRVSNPIAMSIEKYPTLLDNHYPDIIHGLKEGKLDVIRRSCVRYLQFAEIPDDYVGEITSICFSLLSNNREPIAIKVFSMTVLFNISKVYTELQTELVFLIQEQLPYGSTGFKNRANKILKQLMRSSYNI